MLVGFPFAAFLLLFLCLYRHKDPSRDEWSGILLKTAVLWGACLALFTEGLSLFSGIHAMGLASCWAFACLICLFLWRLRKKNRQTAPVDGAGEKTDRGFRLLLYGSIGAMAAWIGFLALVVPPNNFDSMFYHLARVIHWKQNQSVMHYPTTMLNQLFMAPWSEFAMLHFHVLSGSDFLANTIQWCSYLGIMIGSYALVKHRTLDPWARTLAAVAAGTIPMAVMQGSSCQNDLVAGFWMICLVWFLFRTHRSGKKTDALLAGLSLGLALLTKSNCYLFAFPFLCLFAIALLRPSGWKRSLVLLTILGIPAMALNAGLYARNFHLFGHPLGETTLVAEYRNQTVRPAALFLNLVRGGALHLSTPIPGLNRFIETGVVAAHRAFNIPVDAPAISYNQTSFHIPDFQWDETGVPNPLTMILIMAASWHFLRRERKSIDFYYCLAFLISFVLFSGYLKWQPWLARLQLPWFVLGAPLIGLYLAQKKKPMKSILSFALILFCLPGLFLNVSKPVFGEDSIFRKSRIEQYFANIKYFQVPYQAMARYVAGTDCRKIGMEFGINDPEYILWRLMEHQAGQPVEIGHVNVSNVTGSLSTRRPFADFHPCVIFGSEITKEGLIFSARVP